MGGDSKRRTGKNVEAGSLRVVQSESEFRKEVRTKAQTKSVEDWNSKVPIGSKVIVKLDDGTQKETETRSAAYICDAGVPVIFLKDISGFYLLNRCSTIL
jgi:hypothetical protein